ncbi:UrcA family protein [Gluconobacter sp.]|uniref:UrcA family protein n=1 Tax=Gluconobacter sp. TaxID=1876758 RepID=UPI0039EA58F2
MNIARLRPEASISIQIPEMVKALAVLCAIFAGLLLLMAIHGPASAQEAEDSPDPVYVSYVRQDLSDPVKIRRLLIRIDRAALKACGAMDGLSIPTQELIIRSDCHHETFNRTVAAFHSPTLTHLADAIDPWIGPTTQEP